MIKIFITGSRGYIGSELIYQIKQFRPEWKVMGYDLLDGNDILNFVNLLKIMREFMPDIVVHLAGLSTVELCELDFRAAIKINAIGTRNIVQAMHKINCRNIIYGSSWHVYRDFDDIFTEETFPLPTNMLGTTKLLGEHVIFNHYMNNPGNYLLFRLFEVIGVSSNKKIIYDTDNLMSEFLNGHVIIRGCDYPTDDGSYERDYISLFDTCRAFIRGIDLLLTVKNAGKFKDDSKFKDNSKFKNDSKFKNGNKFKNDSKIREVINISSGKSSSVGNLIYLWNNIINTQFDKFNKSDKIKPITFEMETRRFNDRVSICGSNKKLRRLLKWQITQTTEKILYEMISNVTH